MLMSGIDRKDLKGVFAPIPTPLGEDGEVSLSAVRSNMERWVRSGLAGVVVFGSNGEAPYLSWDEKVRLIEAVIQANAGRRLVIAGTGQETTRDTIRLTQKAAGLGAQAALVLPPHFYKNAMTNAVLAAHYRAVADESPIPVIIYNMPGNTGLNLGSELVAELSNHANIAGLKDSSGNIVQIAEIVATAREGFAVFAGSGSYLLPTLAVGGVGATAAVSNVFPDECAAVIRLFDQGDVRGARELQLKLMEINRAVTSRWGVPGLKAAMDIIGLYGGLPRRPMLPLGEAERQELARIIGRTGFLRRKGCARE